MKMIIKFRKLENNTKIDQIATTRPPFCVILRADSEKHILSVDLCPKSINLRQFDHHSASFCALIPKNIILASIYALNENRDISGSGSTDIELDRDRPQSRSNSMSRVTLRKNRRVILPTLILPTHIFQIGLGTPPPPPPFINLLTGLRPHLKVRVTISDLSGR